MCYGRLVDWPKLDPDLRVTSYRQLKDIVAFNVDGFRKLLVIYILSTISEDSLR